MADALEERIAALSDEELDLLNSLSPEEARQVFGSKLPGDAATPPNPAEAFREGITETANDVGQAAGDTLLGAEGTPKNAVVGPVAESIAENLLLGGTTEGGTALGSTLGTMLPIPGGRVLGAAAGGALGFAGGDAALDTMQGEPVEVDPMGVGISALLPAVPALAAGTGKLLQGGGNAIRNFKPPSVLAQRLLNYTSELVDAPHNVPQAFGMKGPQFDVREPIMAAEAIKRIDQRGVFTVAQPKVRSGKFAGQGNIHTDFSDIRRAFAKEKERLVGPVDQAAAPTTPAQVQLRGEVGLRVSEISKTPGTEVSLGQIEEAFDAVKGSYSQPTSSGKVDLEASRIIQKEVEKLRDLTLKPAEITKLKEARDSVDQAHRMIMRSDVAAFRPVSQIDDVEIQKIFGVKLDPEDGRIIPGPGAEKWFNYKNALKDIDNIIDESRKRAVTFGDLYKKRVSLQELAKYGAEGENAALHGQVMTDLTDMLRHQFENTIAEKAGTSGKLFLKAKAELADVLSVEDFIYKAERDSKVPRFSQMLSFGPKATLVRNAATEVRSQRFRLTKRNIGLGLRRVADKVGGQPPKSIGEIAQGNPLPAKLLDSAGEYTLKVADVMGAHDKPVSWLTNTIVNATVFEFLTGQGVVDAEAEELDVMLADPKLNQLVQQTSAALQEQLQPLQRALSLGDEEAAGLELTRISKTYPEAFQTPVTGIRGEVEVDGKPKLYDEQDRERFRTMLRTTKDVPVDKKAELMDELNRTGVVLYVPSAVKPKKIQRGQEPQVGASGLLD